MTIQVKTPDGNIAQFPDGMSDEAISAVLAKEFPAPKTEPAPKQDSMLADIGKSAVSGLAQGAAGVAGLAGDIQDAGAYLAYKTHHLFAPEAADRKFAAYRQANPGIPDSNDVNKGIQAVAGPYHEPQTVPGEYARTIASFAPAALAPGGVAQRIGRVVIPAIASETGGQFTKRTPLEPYARIGGAVAGGLAADPVIRSINAVTSRVGVPIQNPTSTAQTMLANAIRRDGGPNVVNDGLNDWRGASNPALIDVTGNNVRRLVRSAASGGSGEAQNIATTYADRIAGNLQDNSLNLTRRLTPVTNSADDYSNILSDLQRQDAEFNYKAPYAEPATVTPEMVDALQGPEGRSAIGRAFAAARANRDINQMSELQDLKAVASAQSGGTNPITGKFQSMGEALKSLSAGSLDRVRIAMRETGNNLYQKGARDIARGFMGRVDDIDSALNQTPGLQDARASYANYAGQQEAVDLGRTGLNAPPDEYGARISELAAKASPTAQSPGAQTAAGVGYRQALTDAIGRPAEGATGVLNRIATSDNQRRNLEATFGQQTAADYQTGIGNEIDRLRNARFISPNTGSQTELRLQDAGLLNVPVPHIPTIAKIWDKIRTAAQLTDQERTELVRLGTTEARLVNVARANPSLTSRTLATALISRSSGPRQ